MNEVITEIEKAKEEDKSSFKAPEVRFKLSQRHYDLALAEQSVHRARGRHMSVEEILKRNKIESYEIVKFDLGVSEKIIAIFLNPFISGILILVIRITKKM